MRLAHDAVEDGVGDRRITTNLGYKQWGTVFGDAPCLGALVDRFAQHCHVVDIDAEWWREKQRREGRDTNGRGPKKRH